tara:strand:- start:1162 stop:1887 length:726 start_codon:yes stop_codon:yes gene_type:complete
MANTDVTLTQTHLDAVNKGLGSISTEGDLFYRDATGLQKLAKGTASQTLKMNSGATAPEWTTVVAPASPGLNFISSTDISSVASVDMTGLDASSYDAYCLVLSNILPATHGASIAIRTSTDGGSNYDSGASDYEHTAIRSSASVASIQDTDDTMIKISSIGIGTGAGAEGFCGFVYIYGPHITKHTFVSFQGIFADNGGVVHCTSGGGRRESSADVDAVQLLANTGNLASGTVNLFGISNS